MRRRIMRDTRRRRDERADIGRRAAAEARTVIFVEGFQP